MSEDRTQAPSKRRRQEARATGQVARSPELTAAAGLLAAVVLLGIWGGSLAEAMLELIRAPLTGDISPAVDAAAIVARLREAAVRVAWPLGLILGGVAAAMIGAHQAQVGGLLVPALLAPDPARLLSGGFVSGLMARGGRGLWALAKAVVVAAATAWLVRTNFDALARLAHLGPEALAVGAGVRLRALLQTLALATVALGVADFALQWRRIEALLRMSPDEHREELRALDGDPALRGRRRRLAGLLRHDPAEILEGCTLLLTAPALVVVLGGGPPPGRPIKVRHVARGPAAMTLRRAASSAGIDLAEAPELARLLAHARGATPVLPPDLAAELALLWPRADPGL